MKRKLTGFILLTAMVAMLASSCVPPHIAPPPAPPKPPAPVG